MTRPLLGRSIPVSISLLGGRLCLDFTNTAAYCDAAQPQEFLVTYHDLVAWSHHAGILDEREAGFLLGQAVAHPDRASGIRDRAVSLREALYRIFRAGYHSFPVPSADLALFNAELRAALSRAEVVPLGGDFRLSCCEIGALDSVLWPVVWSAVELLTSEAHRRVGVCRGCGWLFLDTSQGMRRRWCDMAVCGNRAKRRRHYQRTRAARAAMTT
jgi:predicted RNA-binding Zn ribbon-like protein